MYVLLHGNMFNGVMLRQAVKQEIALYFLTQVTKGC